jgi:hypothetical protein
VDLTAWFDRAASRIGNWCTMDEIKWARIGPDGKYVGDAVVVPVNVIGGTNAASPNPQYPHQISWTVSLGTGERGRSKRGRLYQPAPFTSSLAGGLAPASDCLEVGNSFAQLVADLNNWPGIDENEPEVVIASSKGFNTKVTEIRVGRALDTIRSRRRSIPESYETVVVPGL